MTTFSIRELAEEFGITTRTLRFYEEKGLLSPTRDKQNRVYSQADKTRLRLILRGKRLGLTLEESSDIISLYDPASGNRAQLEKLIAKIKEKRQQLISQQQDLEHMLNDLEAAEQHCQQAINNSNH